MAKQDYLANLPEVFGDLDLPTILTYAKPSPDRVENPVYLAWTTYASQRHIRDLAKDAKDGLWLATAGGILHWKADLQHYTRYGSEHGLPGNSMGAIAIDDTNRVWAGSDRYGLVYLEGDRWQSYGALGELPVYRLTVDLQGQLWVVASNGVFCIPNSAEPPSVELPSVGDPARAIVALDDEQIWVCTAQGILRRQGDTWQRISSHVQPDILTILYNNNYLWLATMRGLVRLNVTSGDTHQAAEWPRRVVRAIAPAETGLWIACGDDIGLATPSNWRATKGKLPSTDPITALNATGDDEVWIATHDGLWRGDLTELQPQFTQDPPDDIGLPVSNRPPATFSNLVQALVIQTKGSSTELWIGTARGLFRWNRLTDTWRRLGQIGQDIRSMVYSPQRQEIWLSSWAEGLRCFGTQDTDNATPQLPKKDLALSLAAGDGTHLWCIGMNGLYQLTDKTWDLLIPTEKLQTGWIQTVLHPTPNQLWLGTSTGLFGYTLDTQALTPEGGDISSADIRCLLSTPSPTQGNPPIIWAGSRQGLLYRATDTWLSVDGLTGRTINALAWDDTANLLWVGTNLGLFKLTLTNDAWEITHEFTPQTSGLGANAILTLALHTPTDTETKLWVGTPSGLSCYRY